MCFNRPNLNRAWLGLLMITGVGSPQIVIGEESKPSLELLEFLGEFSEADDDWVDPTLLPPLDEIDAAPEAEEDNNEG